MALVALIVVAATVGSHNQVSVGSHSQVAVRGLVERIEPRLPP